MDLNIVLWLGGTLFSLCIFAIKVGFGLGFGRVKRWGVILTLSLYLVLFNLIAILSKDLVKIIEPVLNKGIYLHAIMSSGMILWGVYTIRTKIEVTSLPLILPCPVCIIAIIFSTWMALNVIKLPAFFVGLGLGISFVTLSLLFFGFTRLRRFNRPQINLGLSMLAIGSYFLLSLFLPAKIEEAKGIYKSFFIEGYNIDLNKGITAFTLLFVASIIGFIAGYKRR